MSQHDFDIANQAGAAFRADLNNALVALAGLSSGTSEPTTTYAHQLWADTTSNLLKMRNAANNAWVTLGTIGSTYLGLIAASATATLTAGYSTTPYNAGTKSTGTFTPNETNGNFQYYTNGGAHTLAPPTNNCSLVIQITNNASAGTITTSGFTKVTGTTPGTTNGDDFLAYVTKINGFSHLAWQALQ